MEREIAYKILCEVLLEGKYASLQMKKDLKRLPKEKRGLVTELVNGVLRHFYLLRYQFKDEIKEGTDKRYVILLCMAIYERLFLHKQSYTSNEYVSILKDKHDRSFINAILRKERMLKEPDMSTDEGSATYYSLPLWLYKMLKAQYDKKMLDIILDDLSHTPEVFYRINHQKASYLDLEHLDIEVINEDSFTSKRNLIETEEFLEGYFYIQDLNSAKIYKELDLMKGDVFLDLCAAPGSKTFNALEHVDISDAISNDMNPKRAKLIKDKARELGFGELLVTSTDARAIDPKIIRRADKILIDAPCSGLGVLKRKPDIRYHLKPEDIDDLIVLQRSILEHTLEAMKEGAILVYSTCTLDTKENSRMIKNVLKTHPEMLLLEEKLYLDHPRADRFYSAKLTKSA